MAAGLAVAIAGASALCFEQVPNQTALLIERKGRADARVVLSGWAWRVPGLDVVRPLSLAPFSFQVLERLETRDHERLTVESAAVARYAANVEAVKSASAHLATLSEWDRELRLRELLEAELRRQLAGESLEDVLKRRDLQASLTDRGRRELAKVGVELVSWEMRELQAEHVRVMTAGRLLVPANRKAARQALVDTLKGVETELMARLARVVAAVGAAAEG